MISVEQAYTAIMETILNTRDFLQNRIKSLARTIRKRVPKFESDYHHFHRNTRPDPHSKLMQDELFTYLSAQSLNEYPDLTGLYEKLSDWLELPIDNLLLTQGADDGIRAVFNAFSRPKKAIACLSPSYKMYSVYAEVFETPVKLITPKHYDGGFFVEVKDIVEVLSEGVDLLFIPNPNEPIETCFTSDEVRLIVRNAERYGTIVIIDEAYANFGAESVARLVSIHSNLVVIQSFSKWFGLPAIRLGYTIASSGLTKALHSQRPAYETNVLSMAAAIWALDNLNYFNDYALEVVKTRDWLKAELRGMGISTHGNYSNAITISLSSPKEAEKIASKLKSKGILVRNAIPSPGEHCIGVTIGSRNLMKNFLSSFKECLPH